MQCHVFDRGHRQLRMALESHCPVPDEAVAVTMVAGKVQPGRGFPEPQAVVGSRTGAGQPAVVLDCGCEVHIAVRREKDSPPWLGSATVRQMPNIPSRVSCAKKLGGAGNSAGLFEVIEDVHGAIAGGRSGNWNRRQALCG